jgi:hypothetical protein
LRAFAATIVEDRLLDDLTDRDADTVAMFCLLDFTQGAARMAWRLGDMGSKRPTVQHEYDRELAAIHATARIFQTLLAELLAGEEIDGLATRWPPPGPTYFTGALPR